MRIFSIFLGLVPLFVSILVSSRFAVIGFVGQDEEAHMLLVSPVWCRLILNILNTLKVLAAGSKIPIRVGHVGECTLHARECGSGVGVFFLVQR